MKKISIYFLVAFITFIYFCGSGEENPKDKVKRAYEMIVGDWSDKGTGTQGGITTYIFEKNLKFTSEYTMGNSNYMDKGTYKITEKGNELLLEFHVTWEASKYGGASDTDRKEKPVRLVFQDKNTMKLGSETYKRGN